MAGSTRGPGFIAMQQSLCTPVSITMQARCPNNVRCGDPPLRASGLRLILTIPFAALHDVSSIPIHR